VLAVSIYFTLEWMIELNLQISCCPQFCTGCNWLILHLNISYGPVPCHCTETVSPITVTPSLIKCSQQSEVVSESKLFTIQCNYFWDATSTIIIDSCIEIIMLGHRQLKQQSSLASKRTNSESSLNFDCITSWSPSFHSEGKKSLYILW